VTDGSAGGVTVRLDAESKRKSVPQMACEWCSVRTGGMPSGAARGGASRAAGGRAWRIRARHGTYQEIREPDASAAASVRG